MAMEKQVFVDKIEVVIHGIVQVRTATKVLEDGAVLSQSFHRHVVNPGDDYSKENDQVKAICAAIHTPEVITAYKALAPTF